MAANASGAVARGVAWMLLARLGDRIGGILSIAITARLLSPNDFGMFQMALSVMALVEIFALFGFDWALIRHPEPKREHFDTAFTLQLIFSTATSLVVIALAHPFAAYYRMPELAWAVMAMALAPFVNSLNNLAIVHLRRDMRFEADFWRMFVPRIVGIVACILFAVLWQSYWALIAGVVLAKAASAAVGYVLHPYRPRLSLEKWRELMGFSVWLQIASVIDGLRQRIGDLVIGRQLGSHPLAIYTMSIELANLPQSEFVGALNSAIFTKYARIQNDLAQLRSAYLDILGLTLMVGMPAAVGLVFTAPAAVRLLLGVQWVDVVPVVQILALGALAAGIAANSTFVLMTTGRPKLITALAVVNLVLLLAFLLVLTPTRGVLGAAIGFTAAGLLMLPAHILVLRREIQLELRDLWPRAWRSLFATALMALVLRLGMPIAAPETLLTAAVVLLVAAGGGGLVYTLCLSGLWILNGRPPGLEQMMLAAARDIFTRVAERFGWRPAL